MRFQPLHGLLLVTASALVPATALAQVSPAPDEVGDPTEREATDPAEPLPPPESDNDVAPPVAGPAMPPGGLVYQAGVGGPTGYGRAGVLELGGSAGFTAASDLTQISLTPSIGWFVADNLELSALFGFQYVSSDDSSATYTTILAEPSYHLPFNRSTFGFLGLGIGMSYLDGPGAAFAMTPRLGANVMVGRSGILSPYIAWQYNTHDTEETAAGTVMTVSSAVTANVGYTVMW